MNRSAFVQRVFASALLVGAVLASACDGGDDDGAIPGALTEPYIAFERDFQGFRRWERFDLGRSPAMGDVHLEGHRVDYLNRRPPAGAEEFTFGTIIVKEIEGTRHQIFAMAKRGGGYNASAARGWEWFELEVRPNGSVAIEWRGVEPPAEEKYGGPMVGTCNTCHGTAQRNDYVFSPPLELHTLTGRAPRSLDAGAVDPDAAP